MLTRKSVGQFSPSVTLEEVDLGQCDPCMDDDWQMLLYSLEEKPTSQKESKDSVSGNLGDMDSVSNYDHDGERKYIIRSLIVR